MGKASVCFSPTLALHLYYNVPDTVHMYTEHLTTYVAGGGGGYVELPFYCITFFFFGGGGCLIYEFAMCMLR